MSYGIEWASFYVPSLYLEISDLAENRNLEAAKLEKGLGLKKMAFPDTHEDAATFAAEALLKLVQDSGVDPKSIARIYLGTESAVDGAKPTATYAMGMVEEALAPTFGPRVFKNCDVVDLTFACVGGVDALENCLDFCRAHPGKKAVVIASDYAKYELESSGEYTQGGGAVALLVSNEPMLVEIEPTMGVATESVFDFFKPRRAYKKEALKDAPQSMADEIEIFSDEPVFEGQYSNACYQNRIREAYEHYKEQTGIQSPYKDWRYLIFHLPYAFHGKRVFTELYSLENHLSYSTPEEQKVVAKSPEYIDFIQKKIEPTQRASSEIGNMYTASIFMALLSGLSGSYEAGEDLEGQKLGFFAYGSGSKSKVFSGVVGKEWKEVASSWNLQESLENRERIDFETYEKLHRKQLSAPVGGTPKGFGLEGIESNKIERLGARYYRFVP